MIRKMMSKPLMIAPNVLLDPLFRSVIEGKYIDVNTSDINDFEEQREYQNCCNTAVIPICGVLAKRTGLLDPFFESISYGEISEMISSALEDSGVNSILLNIDSPGGEVGGLFDLVDFIYNSRDVKPIYAIANDCAFSAAYAIASAASKVFVIAHLCYCATYGARYVNKFITL